MIDTINRVTTRNIISVEDPIEFLHVDRQSFIHQREIGLDTLSFADGLAYVLRQDPDIIMVGEVRDLETMRTSLMAADTGHFDHVEPSHHRRRADVAAHHLVLSAAPARRGPAVDRVQPDRRRSRSA